MYYHAIVETDEKNKKGDYERYYEFDNTSLDDINELIIRPYTKNEQIYVNGRYIDRGKIRVLKIKSSDRSLEELRDIAQRELRPNVLFVYTSITILHSNTYVTDITKELLKSAGGILKSSTSYAHALPAEKNKVFIVHGHDALVKTEVARFVEKLGFSAIILHEQASSGKTIIEKIEEHTNVGFAIVLYTPCDIGGLVNEKNQKFRARQNVVFEHGYLIGKLGRHNVCALVKGDIEIPNDIGGVVYVSHDDQGAWSLSIAKEMRNSGYAVDMNKVIWIN